MLSIIVPAIEYWDEKNECFVNEKPITLQLEHSLVSISKWESKWQKSFLSTKDKTNEEILDYIRCMTITQNVDPEIYKRLSNENISQIVSYIDKPMTACKFMNNKSNGNREIITNELIYYWMITCGIPFECQKWHINHLLALIKVCDIKSAKPKKMSQKDLLARNAQLNAARRKKLNSRG